MGVLTCREYCFFLVVRLCFSVVFFFFKQKTAYEVHISDWSSDVCSSDLVLVAVVAGHQQRRRTVAVADHRDRNPDRAPGAVVAGMRHDQRPEADRQCVVQGKSVSDRVDPGGCRIIKTKNYQRKKTTRLTRPDKLYLAEFDMI